MCIVGSEKIEKRYESTWIRQQPRSPTLLLMRYFGRRSCESRAWLCHAPGLWSALASGLFIPPLAFQALTNFCRNEPRAS